MTDLLAPAKRAEPKRDRYGRYIIPDPVTGKERAWTRATTLADTLDDRYNLELWKLRTCAVGLAMRNDLLALVAAHHGDKKQLDKVCADALEAGKASEGANLGTALHALTERIDRGDDALILDSLRADIDAYRQAMTESGLTIATLPDGRLAREVIVLCPELGVAGTADHLFAGEQLIVGDLKTGASAIDWAMTSIAIQLSIYAHATHIYDPATNTLSEKPATDLSTAIVIHLPVGKGTCTLHDVDIAAGWQAALKALWVRGWRKRRNLSTPRATVSVELSTAVDDPFAGVNGEAVTPTPSPQADPAPVPPTVDAAPPAGTAFPRVEWIGERIAQLPAAGMQLLAIRWPKDQARTVGSMRAVPHRDYTDDEIAAIEAVLMPIEREHECPFIPDPTREHEPGWASRCAEIAAAGEAGVAAPDGDDRACASPGEAVDASPVAAPDEGDLVTDDDVDAVAKAFDALKGDEALFARVLLKQMADAGAPLQLVKVRSRRRWSIARAVLALAPFDDEIARACLAVVLGDELQTTVTTGVALCALSIDEAERVADMARALTAGSLHVAYAEDGRAEIKATA